MDYLFYSSVALVVAGLLYLLSRMPNTASAERRKLRLAERARQRRERAAQKDPAQSNRLPQQPLVLQRELSKVPIPWGWPGSETRPLSGNGVAGEAREQNHLSWSLQHWVDHLVAEKRTVNDGEYRERRNAALRSMVEDRFGRTPKPRQMAFQKVRPPRLQDPDRPYDQMDNFPSGRTETIVSRLTHQPDAIPSERPSVTVRKTAQLGEIKTPWGW